MGLAGSEMPARERRIASEEVYADFVGDFIESLNDFEMSFACRRDKADGSNRDALVYDRNAYFARYIVAYSDEVARLFHKLVVYLVAGALGTVRNAVEQRNAERYRSDVEVLMRHHVYSF